MYYVLVHSSAMTTLFIYIGAPPPLSPEYNTIYMDMDIRIYMYTSIRCWFINGP